MNRFKLLYATLVGTILYVIVAILVGRDGLWAQRQLESQKRAIYMNKTNIETINDELKMEKEALLRDSDVIAGHARKLGYIFEGEKLVKITGLPERETRLYDAGLVKKHESVNFMPESFCKIIGLTIGILVYIVLFLAERNKGMVSSRHSEKNMTVEGASIYGL